MDKPDAVEAMTKEGRLLTQRELTFVSGYLESGCKEIKRSAELAGYSHPAQAGQKLLRKEHIQQAIVQAKSRTQEKVIEKIATVAAESFEVTRELVAKALATRIQDNTPHHLKAYDCQIKAIELGIKYLQMLGQFPTAEKKGPATFGAHFGTQVNVGLNLGGEQPAGVSPVPIVPIPARMYMSKHRRERLGIDSPLSERIEHELYVGAGGVGTGDAEAGVGRLPGEPGTTLEAKNDRSNRGSE